MAGLGALAYAFGLRHAFDADHIAAIDDTIRLFVQRGRRPLGVGFFFSLGHSTVVFALAVGLALAARRVESLLPSLASFGALTGASISALFLWIVGLLNLAVFLEILRIWRRAKSGEHEPERLDALLAERGLVSRLFRGRFQGFLQASWHMYPLGVLFGLGFDTASETGLLAITAGAAGGEISWPAVLSLPLLFAAGMTLMDTADGVFMSKAYTWALSSPLRKIYYNLATTALSVAVALGIGTVELLQVLGTRLRLGGPLFDFLGRLDFEVLGYGIVAMFLCAWVGSAVWWKVAVRLDEGVIAGAGARRER
jgi:high-affinity nickel-transport protein